MPSRRVIAALVVIAAAWGPAASASQLAGVGTGSVVGVVRDAAGLRVPGVGITISGLALMTPRKMTTRADGEYRFASLPPGDYVLTFVSPGFESLERQAHVSLGFTLTIDVTLTVAPQREEIAVYGALDRHSAAVSQSFDASQLASLPGSRSMGGLFAVTHAVALPVAEVGGGTGIISGGYGAYGRNNSPRHTIEGIVVTGLFGAGFVARLRIARGGLRPDRRTWRRMADSGNSYGFRDEVGLESVSRHDLRCGRASARCSRPTSTPIRSGEAHWPVAGFGQARSISYGTTVT